MSYDNTILNFYKIAFKALTHGLMLMHLSFAAPVFTPAPDVIGISSYDLTLSWAPPLQQEARGMVIEYRVYHLIATDLTTDPFAPPFLWQVWTVNLNIKYKYKQEV